MKLTSVGVQYNASRVGISESARKKRDGIYTAPTGKYLVLVLLLLVLVACGNDKPDNKDNDPKPTATAEGVQARITAEQAPVFAEANSNAAILTTLFKGDLRNVEAKSEPDVVGITFYRLDLGNQVGWIAETQIELLGDATALGIDDSTAVAVVPSATPTLEIILTIESTPSTPLAQVNVTRAVVLSAPSRSAEALVTAFEGERLAVLGVTAPDDLGDVYYQVELGTQIGWMLQSQVQILGDVSMVRLIENTAIATEVASNPTEALPTETLSAATTQTAIAMATAVATISHTPIPSIAPTRTLLPNEAIYPQPPPTLIPTARNEIQEWTPPPLSIEVPAGWQEIHVLVPVASRFMAGNVGMSVYEGDLGNGLKGTIWVVWGFPNIGTMFGEVNLWADGLQILRGLMFAECNIGIDTQREYTIDGYTGVGTIFSAVDCPEGDDIAGWFTAMQVEGGNYALFMGIQPVERVTEGLTPLQAIIDTIHFDKMPD